MRSRLLMVLGLVLVVYIARPPITEAAVDLCGLPFVEAGCSALGSIGFENPVGSIVSSVLGWVVGIAGGLVDTMVMPLIDALPDAGSIGAPNLAGILVGYVWLDHFLPIADGVTVSALLLATWAAKWGFRSMLTVYHIIPKPFIGT